MSAKRPSVAIPRPTTPRIPPLPAAERTEWQAQLLEGITLGGPTVNIFETLVRHPGLFAKWMPFGGKLLNGKLPARDREILILRTGWRCQSEYEWAQHVVVGRRAGMSDEEIDRVALGETADGWDAFDALLIHAADELHDDACISDSTWAKLRERYDDQQMLEVTMTVGHYHLVSFTLNSLGIQVEDGVTGFPS